MIDKSRRMCYSDTKSGELVKQAERKSSNFDPAGVSAMPFQAVRSAQHLMRVMPP